VVRDFRQTGNVLVGQTHTILSSTSARKLSQELAKKTSYWPLLLPDQRKPVSLDERSSNNAISPCCHVTTLNRHASWD
jgi:hypothetical protein